MRLSSYFIYIILLTSMYHTVQAQNEAGVENTYIEGAVGGSIPQLSQTQTTVLPAALNLQPQDVAHTQQAGAAWIFSLGAGKQFTLHATPNLSWLSYYRLGLRYVNQQAENLSGQGSWPSYSQMQNVYQYTYRVQTQLLLADLALNLYNWQRISTYLHLAAGITFVKASTYKETAGTNLPGKETYAFSNHQANKFGSIIGLGLDYSLNTNWHALFTYDYFPPLTAALGKGMPLLYATPVGPLVSLANQSFSLGLRYVF